MRFRPARGEFEESATDAATVHAFGDGKIRNVAVGRFGEEIGRRLQVQEARALAGFRFGDEEVR